MPARTPLTVAAAIVAGLVVVCPVGQVLAAESASAFDPASATYAFEGDTFTLAAGRAQIMGHSGLSDASDTPIPIGYTLGKSASGDLNGGAGDVVALYRNFGANLQWITLFAFGPADDGFKQIAAGPAYQTDADLQSLSLAHGVVTVHLLVVSDADKLRPHYEQKPTQPLTLQFKLEDGAFVEMPDD